MIEQKQAEFTLGERRYLERVREAQSEGLSLRDYYLAHGLSVRMLSRVQRRLAQKGMVPQPNSAAAEAGKQGKLIEVRVADAAGRAGLAGPAPISKSLASTSAKRVPVRVPESDS